MADTSNFNFEFDEIIDHQTGYYATITKARRKINEFEIHTTTKYIIYNSSTRGKHHKSEEKDDAKFFLRFRRFALFTKFKCLISSVCLDVSLVMMINCR